MPRCPQPVRQKAPLKSKAKLTQTTHAHSVMLRGRKFLSTLLSSSKSSVLNQMQAVYGLKICWEAFSTDILKPAEGGNLSKDRNPFITFVLGGPGVGKGTQCLKLAETFGFTHLSAGDLLRKEISSNSENGAMILETIAKGKIVPSETTVSLIKRAIESSGNDKFLIDGFPRTEENRINYERIIDAIGPEDEIFDRVRQVFTARDTTKKFPAIL